VENPTILDFLSANLDRGHKFSCTAINSPSLSKSNNIIPDVIVLGNPVGDGGRKWGHTARGSSGEI
jgi:hypothetical protein